MPIRDSYPVGSNVCIHCPSEEDASKLFALLNEEEYTWADGKRLNPEATWWREYMHETCYSLTDADGVMFSGLQYFKDEKWEIIEMSDFIGRAKENVGCPQVLTEFLCGLMGK